MRKQGYSEERIRQAVTDWLLKPVPRTNRLNGYTKELGLAGRSAARLIHSLTPEQRAKAESIFRHICEKHRIALAAHPRRRAVYWACAVSRVRANASYAEQRKIRNWHKARMHKFPKAGVDKPEVRLERENRTANAQMHRLMDLYEARNG